MTTAPAGSSDSSLLKTLAWVYHKFHMAYPYVFVRAHARVCVYVSCMYVCIVSICRYICMFVWMYIHMYAWLNIDFGVYGNIYMVYVCIQIHV